jgi:transcriptional antiterminator Rof (Rho-off)
MSQILIFNKYLSMKNVLSAMVIVALMFGMVACDELEKLEKLDDFTIQNTWKKSFDIDYGNASETIPFEDSYTLNIRQEDETLQPVLDRLEKFTVNEINLFVMNFIGNDEAAFEGSFSFHVEGSTEPLLLSSFDKVLLADLYETETPIKLNLNNEEKKALEKALKDEDQLIISLAGTLSNTPASFTLRVVIDAQTEFSAFK